MDRSKFRLIGVTSSHFFIIQIAMLLIFQSDNLIITHALGAAQVTPYAVGFKLTSYAAVLQSLMAPALWPATPTPSPATTATGSGALSG